MEANGLKINIGKTRVMTGGKGLRTFIEELRNTLEQNLTLEPPLSHQIRHAY